MKFEDIPNSRISEIVDEYIHSQRDRGLMKDRYINGFTYERLGEMYDLSTLQVKRIVYKQSERLQHLM